MKRIYSQVCTVYKKCLYVPGILLTLQLALSASGQNTKEPPDQGPRSPNIMGKPMPFNFGITTNVFGYLIGNYNLGLFSYVTDHIRLGAYGSYYNTYNSSGDMGGRNHYNIRVNPAIKGWQTWVREDYLFAGLKDDGFVLGATVGYEWIKEKYDTDTNWNQHDDPIWSVIPGYRWVLSPNADVTVGAAYGQSFGEVRLRPEVSLTYTF